jgi:predicted translin family RNA/ssDNA-binding protein
MIDKKYMGQLKGQILDYSRKRRDLIKLSSDILNGSKKAIFAMQRDDIKDADRRLAEAKKAIAVINKKHKGNKKILNEGSYKAGLEEYVEASIFRQFIAGKKICKIPGLTIDANLYISGLCDVPGELLRYAIKSATERNFEEVNRCFKMAEDIIGETMSMNLTGYNRQKFDQSKGALNKLQHIVYEVSMKS